MNLIRIKRKFCSFLRKKPYICSGSQDCISNCVHSMKIGRQPTPS